jgi:hypothetical protein
MYKAYITTLTNVRKHPNADRLLLADVFGNTVCVSTNYVEGEIGVYFPTDGQLSVEFAEQNNLIRKKDENGNNIGGYMDPDKRNVTAIRLRGEKSDGLFLPLSCLYYTGVDFDTLNVGDVIDGLVNGHEICCKYIPRSNTPHCTATKSNKTRKKKVPTAPLFKEHADTEQLAYNLSAFKPGDEIEITLKMHGTSQRTGYLPVLNGYKRTLWERITRKEGTPIYDYGYVSGTRRVVLENYEGGFYGDNQFREQHSKVFEGKLWKGETVYYEVVGFTTSGAPIMGDASNKKLNDKEFIKQYGEITRFSYGCEPYGHTCSPCICGEACGAPQSDIYVYRMTMTNPDGEVIEYTPDFMRYRCEQMAVKTVPVFWKGTIPADLKTEDFFEKDGGGFDDWIYAENAGEWIKNIAEQYYDGPDPVGKTHVREGVVVRIINRPKFAAYKHKNFSFKVLEGIAKVDAEAPDMEEAQEVSDDT